jgi:Flp pilus assembly pilin Flp
MIEYCLILSMVLLACIFAVQQLGVGLEGSFSRLGSVTGAPADGGGRSDATSGSGGSGSSQDSGKGSGSNRGGGGGKGKAAGKGATNVD